MSKDFLKFNQQAQKIKIKLKNTLKNNLNEELLMQKIEIENYTRFFSFFKEFLVDIKNKKEIYLLNEKFNSQYFPSHFLKTNNKHEYKNNLNIKKLFDLNKNDDLINEIILKKIKKKELMFKTQLAYLVGERLNLKKQKSPDWKEILFNRLNNFYNKSINSKIKIWKKDFDSFDEFNIFFNKLDNIQESWFWHIKWEINKKQKKSKDQIKIDKFFEDKAEDWENMFSPIWHSINYLSLGATITLFEILWKTNFVSREKLKKIFYKILNSENDTLLTKKQKQEETKNYNKMIYVLRFWNRLRNSIAHYNKFQHFILQERKRYIRKNYNPKYYFSFIKKDKNLFKYFKEQKWIDKEKKLSSKKLNFLAKNIKVGFLVRENQESYVEDRIFQNISLLFF